MSWYMLTFKPSALRPQPFVSLATAIHYAFDWRLDRQQVEILKDGKPVVVFALER